MQCASANQRPAKKQEKYGVKEIKKALIDRGTTVSQAARSLGYARNTVSLAIHHPRLFPNVRAKLFKHLNLA